MIKKYFKHNKIVYAWAVINIILLGIIFYNAIIIIHNIMTGFIINKPF